MVNKTIRKAKKCASKLCIPAIGPLRHARFEVHCDASFGAHDNGASHAGYIVFLVGDNGKYIPLSWQSRKIKRVVKSTHAAETLAMVDAMEAAFYYRKFLLEILQMKDSVSNFPITCKTDNRALYDSAHTSTQILDKRLRIETSIIRELLDRGEVHKLDWIPTSHQIADGLTKRGVPSSKILDHVGVTRVPLP